MILFPGMYGIGSVELATRISFLTVGLWWFGFAEYTFYYLPSNIYDKKPEGNYLLNGFSELGKSPERTKGTKTAEDFSSGFLLL